MREQQLVVSEFSEDGVNLSKVFQVSLVQC